MHALAPQLERIPAAALPAGHGARVPGSPGGIRANRRVKAAWVAEARDGGSEQVLESLPALDHHPVRERFVSLTEDRMVDRVGPDLDQRRRCELDHFLCRHHPDARIGGAPWVRLAE